MKQAQLDIKGQKSYSIWIKESEYQVLTHQRAWYPRVNLWMVMAELRLRRYFLRASQQRMVFWMRMQAARNLSALSFSK